eukprot:2350204-Alexandrium_andersonii.AAC.1
MTSGPSACRVRATPRASVDDCKFSSPAVPHLSQLGPATRTGPVLGSSSSSSAPVSPRPAARMMAAAATAALRAGKPSQAKTRNEDWWSVAASQLRCSAEAS